MWTLHKGVHSGIKFSGWFSSGVKERMVDPESDKHPLRTSERVRFFSRALSTTVAYNADNAKRLLV
ncbi:hypothetical protein [Chroococcidiopsis sp. CCNUC1]|uniref:hypothetical protein n=1 Tax=Chroococcidiopsis sp. CCNUC1 TaxID=2653189 RepID=UPI0020215528|nr:hypothetical protein [Chroococcidiopsis sp. CCNUC1]URD53727.1 hypothetical protein M5J74_32030 [Chroococcidiopsis sp. CCNUC1]